MCGISYIAVTLSHLGLCVCLPRVKRRSTKARRVLIVVAQHSRRPATVERGHRRVRCKCTHCPLAASPRSGSAPTLARCCTRPVSSLVIKHTDSHSRTVALRTAGNSTGLSPSRPPEGVLPSCARRPTFSATAVPSLSTDLDHGEPSRSGDCARAHRERWHYLDHCFPWHRLPPPLPPPPPPSHPRRLSRPHMNPIPLLVVSLNDHNQRGQLGTTTKTTTRTMARQAGGIEEASGSSGHIVVMRRTARGAPSMPAVPSPTTTSSKRRRTSRPISSQRRPRRRRHQSRSRPHHRGLDPLRPRPCRHLPRPLLG